MRTSRDGFQIVQSEFVVLSEVGQYAESNGAYLPAIPGLRNCLPDMARASPAMTRSR